MTRRTNLATIERDQKARAAKRRLFRFYAGRDVMRRDGYILWLEIMPRPDMMGERFGYYADALNDLGREVLCWWRFEARIPWPLIDIRARSDAAEIRFRQGLAAIMERSE